MSRILTGIQSSGKPHLGNILGAIKPSIELLALSFGTEDIKNKSIDGSFNISFLFSFLLIFGYFELNSFKVNGSPSVQK